MQYRAALPKSLDALRVFDAAARHLSFSRAAEELLVTQAAVSRRIQGLEAELGMVLFERAGRRIALTTEGTRLALSVAEALDYLNAELAPIIDHEDGRMVTISASTSVSHLWLASRLRAFAAAGAGSVRVLSTDSLREAAEGTNDICILYGQGSHPDWHMVTLMRELLQPVASPDYLARKGIEAPEALSVAQVQTLDLMDYVQLRPQWITLIMWFSRMAQVTITPGRVFSSYIMAVEAAERGEGVMLGSLELLAPQIAEGTLVPIGTDVLESGMVYALGLRRAPAPPESAVRLFEALCAAEGPATPEALVSGRGGR